MDTTDQLFGLVVDVVLQTQVWKPGDCEELFGLWGFLQSSGAVWKSSGCPGLPVPNSSNGLCGHKATLNFELLSLSCGTAIASEILVHQT